MSKFERLRKLDIAEGQTSRYVLYGIQGEPYLDVLPAAEINKPYFNALLKRARKNLRRLRAGAVTAAQIAENRDEDRALYPKHVVRGWGKVVDDDGAEVPFSPEACAELLEALPDHMFDDLRIHCSDPLNFLPEGEDDPVDAEVTGKN